MDKTRKYWLHRISHEMDVSYPLLDKEYLSIGFSDFLLNPQFLENMLNPELERFSLFEKENEDRWGGKYRTRYNLWRFLCEFQEGDWILVPSWGVFSVYEIVGKPIYAGRADIGELVAWNKKRVIPSGEDNRYLKYEDGIGIDIGFVIKVKEIEKDISRTDYAENRLLSRLKMRQTNANISDLKDEIENAVNRHQSANPINIYSESLNRMSECLKEVIDNFVSPDQFEQLIKSYFERIGADEVQIPSKSDGEGIADADVVARFDNLKQYVFCQAKHHSGTTGKWAVDQIAEYLNPENRKSFCEEVDAEYTNVGWVISEADDFDREAKLEALRNNIRLINGEEFRKMIIDSGLSIIDKARF